MDVASGEPEATPARRGIDRGLALLIAGALVLIVLGLISIPLASRRAPALAPAATPEGTVQRFYQAAYRGDYSAAYAFLSAEAQRHLSVAELQQQLSAELRNSQVRTGTTTLHDTSATVRVTLTHFQPGGLFGSSEWSNDREVLLQREGDTWKITGGAFFLEGPR